MKHAFRRIVSLSMLTLLPAAAMAQTGGAAPVVKIEIARTIQAVNYKPKQSAKVDFVGTELMPQAKGQAKVDVDSGGAKVEASFEKLEPPSKFGPYLTYVLWAITPEGRTSNLGELMLNKDKASVSATTRFQSFGLIVTAEPYYAVAFPSEAAVLENSLDKDLQKQAEPIQAQAELFQRGQYTNLKAPVVDPKAKIPNELYQARNAAAVALAAKADQFAPESWAKAKQLLDQAEAYQVSKKGKERDQVAGIARRAVQAAADSRIIAMKRSGEAQVAAEKKAAAEREAKVIGEAQAEAKAAGEREAQAVKAAAEANAARSAALSGEEKAKAQAAEAAQQAAQAADAAAAADAAQKAALAQEQEAKAQAAAATQSATQLRASLLGQFNKLLPTKDSPRGLIVNLGGVNFPSGKADLSVTAKERLSRFTGLVAAHPGLKFQVEGHTDNVGAVSVNQQLSQTRAEAVRDYLVQQGLPAESISAEGLGDADPVASNNTSEGRAQNRRVDIVVSGDVIGTPLGK
jgi:outer membrane protein OmpA-like peptidoglycan-associated protein